jgi:lipoprotein-releasing system permease protein
MPYEIFLALRHLRSRRKRRLARVTTVIALAGISIGVAALIFAQALANGFRDEMRDKILRGTSHMTIMRSDGQPISDYKELASQIAAFDNVTSAAGTTYDGAVLAGPKGSAYAILRGFDPTTDEKVNVERVIVEGSVSPLLQNSEGDQRRLKVLVGAELASRTGLKVGDTAELLPANSNSSALGVERRRAEVAGIFRTGLFEYDSTWVYLPLEAVTSLTGGQHAASVISVQVDDPYHVKDVATALRNKLGAGYTVVDWQEANRPLFTALELERRIGLITIAIIILIAALNITSTLILVVVERRRDIAILNAMGATGTSIMSVFVIEGAIVGLVGALTGVVLGSLATFVANHFNLISLPAEVYSIAHVPLNLNVRDALIAALVAVTLSVLATIYPARAAAVALPADLLRDA